nr:carboxylesterase 1D-like [Leptinotarsa decemlineata]
MVVTIKSGKVLGKKLTTADLNVDFYAFQGIPYAQPPLGNLRFRPPIPVGQWSGILNTTEDKPQCIQNLGDGSEDCLFINVFSPTVYSLERLPVFVWFFGGYFISGDSTRSSYGPDYFLEEGVVVVTFNYRLGVFGFLSTEDDVAPGNWALKDQILALKWIQENIEVFGGDPNSVTLAGESAGSVCISYLLQCPLAKNLFHRAVLQSGTSLNYLALSRNPREIAFEIGRLFGIFTNDSKHLVNELRKIDEGMLQSFSFAKNLLKTLWDNPRNGISFSPNIEPASDTAVITNKSYGLWKDGEFMKVPLMIGFNSQESVTVLWVIGAARGFLEVYDISPELLIPVDFNLKTSDFFKRIAVATEIRLHYFGIVPLTLDINHLLQFITDDQFVRGITETVRLASNFTTVYFYRFSYVGDLGLYPSQKRVHEGVGHTEELGLISIRVGSYSRK